MGHGQKTVQHGAHRPALPQLAGKRRAREESVDADRNVGCGTKAICAGRAAGRNRMWEQTKARPCVGVADETGIIDAA